MLKKLQLVLILLLLGIIVLGTCFIVHASIDRFTVSIPYDPETLDPHKTGTIMAIELCHLVYDRLVYTGADGSPQPWLAESWEIMDDGKVIVFQLREGITFHDGTEFNSYAVKHTFQRLIGADWGSTAQQSMEKLNKVEVIDEYSVKFVLEEPYAPFFVMMDHPHMSILSPNAASLDGNDNLGRSPVGTGPFKVIRYSPGDEIVMVSYQDHINYRQDVDNPGAPYINELVFKIIPEEGTAVMALETGEINMTGAPLEDLPWLIDDPQFKVKIAEGATNFTMVEFNHKRAPFNDINIRKAVGFAINEKEVIDIAWGGFAQVNHNPLPTGVPGHNREIGEAYGYVYNPEKAIELLEQSGWELGEDGMRYKNNEPLKITFQSFDAPIAVRAATSIQYQLNLVGFDVNLEILETGMMIAGIRAEDRQPDMFFMRWTWPDPEVMRRMFKSPSWTGLYSNPSLDPVLDKIVTTVDWNDRVKYIDEAQKMLLEDAALIPISSETKVIATESDIINFKWDMVGFPLFQDVQRED